MKQPYPYLAAMAFLAVAGTGVAGAQMTSPAPAMTMAPMPSPSSEATAAPAATTAPTTSPAPNNGQHKGQIKHLKTATLTTSQYVYALTHQISAAKQIAKMHTLDFNKIRIVRLPSLLKLRYHLGALEFSQVAATQPMQMLDAPHVIAQATSLPTTNGNNSPLQYLHNVLANINVSNALNNLLNNSNVNVGVSLSNVLNNDKIAIGQVVGIYIGGGGIINTVIK